MLTNTEREYVLKYIANLSDTAYSDLRVATTSFVIGNNTFSNITDLLVELGMSDITDLDNILKYFITDPKIDVELCRISNDSKTLDFVINLPEGYLLYKFIITEYNSDAETKQIFDISKLATTNPFSKSITLDQLLGDKKMYQINLQAIKTEIINDITTTTETDEVTVIVSDVNFVYDNLKKDLLKLDARCIEDANIDDLNRKYLLLFAHENAMKHDDFLNAKIYYNILLKNFNHCENPRNELDTNIRTGCSCNK